MSRSTCRRCRTIGCFHPSAHDSCLCIRTALAFWARKWIACSSGDFGCSPQSWRRHIPALPDDRSTCRDFLPFSRSLKPNIWIFGWMKSTHLTRRRHQWSAICKLRRINSSLPSKIHETLQNGHHLTPTALVCCVQAVAGYQSKIPVICIICCLDYLNLPTRILHVTWRFIACLLRHLSQRGRIMSLA